MVRPRLILGLVLLSGLATGCRNPMFMRAADVVDDVNDTHLYLDSWYNPRVDVSRAGKPDWAGPVNRSLNPGICYLGSWKRYDDQNLYPPSNPYSFPSYTMPPPKVRSGGPKPEDVPAEPVVPPEPAANTPD